MNTKPNPIPDTYRRVTPCLVVRNAAQAIEFYTDVFGAIERMRMPGPGGTIAHAELMIGDSVLIIEDESPHMQTKAPAGDAVSAAVFHFVYVEDVDAVIARAVDLGSTLKREPQDQFYGDRDGYIVDPFGHGWVVASHVEDVSPEEGMRRMQELMSQ